MFMRLLLVSAMMLTFGCANQSTVEGSGGGTEKVFASPYDDVRPAAMETLQGFNIDIKKTEPDGTGIRIVFSKPMTAWSWGEVGKVTVRPLDENATLVIIDTEKRYQVQVTGTDEQEFSEALFGGIQEVLDRSK